MERSITTGPVAVLPESVARRIAAGEVIERPASVVRELLDNSIDAGAASVTVEIRSGGLESIRVDDDGAGMSRDDLELCWKPHATSKISRAEDLTHCRTLGFRGEALSSVAAVSRLEIRSRQAGAEAGHRLLVSNNRLEALEPAATSPGTTVAVEGLFYNLPGRKRFLKTPRSEAQQIRKVILEKALPQPEIRFRLIADGKEQLLLPPGSLEERAGALFGDKVAPQSIHRLEGSGEGFSLTVLAADPSQVRRDRKQIYTFVNGRRLREYALLQAVDYAFTDTMHGGLYPYAVLIVEVDPGLVDFNIHPAKQEARFRNLQEIHHRTVEIIRSFLHSWERRRLSLGGGRELKGWEQIPPSGTEAPRRGAYRGNAEGGGAGGGFPGHAGFPGHGHGHGGFPGHAGFPGHGHGGGGAGTPPAGGGSRPPLDRPFDINEVRERVEAKGVESSPRSGEGREERERLTYHGRLFDLFLLVSRGDRLYIIDQHASHERLLYDEFKTRRAVQPLLVPWQFETNEDESAAIARNLDGYREIGLEIVATDANRWEIRSVPEAFREDAESLIETVVELRGLSDELDRRFTAQLACKAAVKRGDILDEISAEELARRVLELDIPRCPHGRPLWYSLSEAELLQLIGRTH